MSLLFVLSKRARAYRDLFDVNGIQQKSAALVLADLARFCNYRRPSLRMGEGAIDAMATMVAEGRREVFLRILHQCNITEDQLDAAIQQAGRSSDDQV